MTRIARVLMVAATLAGAGCVAGRAGAADVTLVKDGKALAPIYHAAEAPKDVQDAAAELVRIFEVMSGAKLEIRTVAARAAAEAPPVPAILLGDVAGLGVQFKRTSRAGDGYRFRVADGRLLIGGESPSGIYTGTMRFLETLGCGWYTPGAVGEVIPRRATIAIPADLDQTDVSDSINRRFWYGGKNGNGAATEAWLRRINGGNYQSGSWNHAYGGLIGKDVLAAHPEYGSLNRGARSTRQLCTTNPEVIRLAAQTLLARMAKEPTLVFAAGPNDGGGLCECPECAKLDTPGYVEPSSGKPACSDRVFQFAADVAALTSKQYPDRDLGILVYSEYSRLPVKMTKVSPNVFPMIAPIRRCRLHGPGNPLCEMNKLWQEEIAGWAKLGPKLGFYLYNYNLADSLLPFTKFDCYRRVLAEVHKANIQQLAWIFETIDSWAMMAPSLYLSARASWNSNMDVDAELARFYAGFYGAAAAPMARYWNRVDQTYATTNAHTGSSYAMHKFWTPAMLAASRADLDEARKLAANPREQEAVAMADAGLRCAELFRRIWDALAAADFAAALKAQGELQAHVTMMAEKPDPHWAHERYAFSQYYKTFIGRTVEAGAKLLADGGSIVVKLPDVWRFALDEQKAGTDAGWWKPDFDDKGWRAMGTMSTSWVDEGLTWYQGEAWYRVAFDVPAAAKGQDLRLWFGGFDNNVDVWLNGQHLGEKTGFVKPQEFEGVGAHVVYGGKNVLAVRVAAGGLSEIGTGGLMMPVVLYAAKAKSAAPATPEKKPYEM